MAPNLQKLQFLKRVSIWLFQPLSLFDHNPSPSILSVILLEISHPPFSLPNSKLSSAFRTCKYIIVCVCPLTRKRNVLNVLRREKKKTLFRASKGSESLANSVRKRFNPPSPYVLSVSPRKCWKMAENPKLQTCNSLGEFNQMGTQKISVSDRTDNLQLTSIEADSFIVDMESLSLLADKDLSANSRDKLQRSLSRKGGSQHREKKINSNIDIDGDPNVAAASASPRGDLTGASTPEKPMMVKVGTTADHPMNPQGHHQITIMAGNVGASNAESRYAAKKLSIRRSPPSWTVDPRKIFFFLATLSSMGTMLMIYFTLCMGKVNEDDNALNW